MSKKLKWIILILAVIAVAAFLYLRYRKSNDFDGLVKEKLTSLVHKASNGLYKLSMEDIEIDLLKSTITANNVLLVHDSIRMLVLDKNQELPDDIFKVTLKKLVIKGISPQDFINSNNIKLSQIMMDSPDVVITHQKRNYNRKDTGSVYNRIATKNETYELKNLLLQNIRLSYKNVDKKNQLTVLQNLTAVLDDIKIDATTARDTSRFFFAKDAVIYLKKYATITPNKLYHFSIDSIALNPRMKSMQAKSIRLLPIGSKDDFSDKVPYLKDRFDVDINDVNINNINWWGLLSNDGFFGDNMNLTGGFIKVYNDRRLPISGISKVGNYPHQLLMALDFPVKMDQISINNVDISYEEFNPASDISGILEFKNTSGTIKNITNIPDQIAANMWMRVTANTKVMNEGNLNAVLNFDLSRAAGGIFTADATLGSMDGKKLNRASKGLGLVEIEDLVIDKLETHIKGNNDNANGTVLFAYHDLKIAALKNKEDGKLKKRALLSFIANNFVIKSNSPQKGKAIKKQVVTYKRDTNRSFFNLIWQTMAEGIILTAKGK